VKAVLRSLLWILTVTHSTLGFGINPMRTVIYEQWINQSYDVARLWLTRFGF
jgi:hypothetical protein